MLAPALRGCRQARQPLLRRPGRGSQCRDQGRAASDRAGLVEHDRGDPLCLLDRRPVTNQDPASAPLPVPTMIAVGVASPIAQGQAMISTATAAVSADGRRGSAPSSIHSPKARLPPARPPGRSARSPGRRPAEIGAFEPCARSTRRAIWARVVSRPTRSARITNEPDAFIVAPVDLRPRAACRPASTRR